MLIRFAPSFSTAFRSARRAVGAAALFSAICFSLPVHADDSLLNSLLDQSRWRAIGPATMGGRIADIAVEEKNPYVWYAALATGGLLKTTNDGATWTPLFDNQPVASVGAVAVAPSDPKIVWVGTGEANGRNSSSWGNGVYKSTDSGKTWQHMGLADTQEIGRVIIDPKDPNIVLVAATGHLWGPNRERGIFRTADGGKSWQHTLAIDADTGAIDVAQGAPGSGLVYAAMYQRRRYAWGFAGTGPGSGLYRSKDGGKTWVKLTKGLPEGALGRIGIAVSRSKPETAYAVIESPKGGSSSLFDERSKYGGIFRTDDAGESWKRVSPGAPRGFYFGQIRVDPTDSERIYLLGFNLAVSEDGGKTFKHHSERVHSDLHALWIDPARPERLLLGTDGGVYLSHDRSLTWRMVANFPMGEFYEVKVDNQDPFWVYGGLQDNGCWAGPSATRNKVGPGNSDWRFLNGGDGFYVVPDPVNSDIVYAESQGGGVVRLDRRTGIGRGLQAKEPEGAPAYRFNWNAPICLSPFDSDSVYIGGNQVFRWFKKGKEYEVISPDLSKQHGARITSAGSGAETYGTVVTLAASPVERGLLWAGTDDGNVQVTRDEGKHWTDLTGNLSSNVRSHYVKRIEASRYYAGRAYVAIDGHRDDDMAPYLFVTEDYGKSWRSIVSDLPKHGPVRAFREDPVAENLLFAGTEFGAFVSVDRGRNWRKLDSGLPTVAVDDFAIQTRDHSLVAATHGRSIFVIDNITPLEEWSEKVQSEPVHLFPIKQASIFLPDDRTWFGGSSEYYAQNTEAGAEIVYWVKAKGDAAPSITIADSAGKTITTLAGEAAPGIHRVRWNMRQEVKSDDVFAERIEHFVKPGAYTVTLELGKDKNKVTQKQTLNIVGSVELSEVNLRELSDPSLPADKPQAKERE